MRENCSSFQHQKIVLQQYRPDPDIGWQARPILPSCWKRDSAMLKIFRFACNPRQMDGRSRLSKGFFITAPT
jgi:hypothetical protein